MLRTVLYSRKGVGAAILAWIALFFLFGGVYYAMDNAGSAPALVYASGAEAGRPVHGLFQCLYFSAVTQATVGFGDIVPASRAAQGIVIVHVLLSALSLAAIGGLFAANVIMDRIDGAKESPAPEPKRISVVKIAPRGR